MENNHDNEFEKKPYDPDAQYGFPSRIYGTTVIYQYRAAIYSLFSEILSCPLHTDFSEKDG